MSKIFLSGSRSISRLPSNVLTRLENIIVQGHDVVTGDANGVDKAIQRFFFDRRYHDVTIYHIGEEPRNNVGSWCSIAVLVTGNYRGRDLYTQKDKRMAEIADSGMIIWDGKSSGSVQNMIWLMENGKSSLVYHYGLKNFYKIKTRIDLADILDCTNEFDRAEIDRKIGVEKYISGSDVRVSQEAFDF